MTTVEPLTADDLETVAKWLSAPAINRWLTADWRERASPTVIAIAMRNRRNRMFLVRHAGTPCGLVALADIEPQDRTAMVWYALGVQEWSRKGITSNALRQLLQIAFEHMELRSVYAWAMDTNTASWRVLQKAGFRPAGRIRQSACLEGHQVDRVYFDLTAAEHRAMMHVESPVVKVGATEAAVQLAVAKSLG